MCEKQLCRSIYLDSEKGRFVGKLDGTNKPLATIRSLQLRLGLRTKQRQRLNDPATFPARSRLAELGGSLRRVSASSKQGLVSFLSSAPLLQLCCQYRRTEGTAEGVKRLHHALP
jgi:hypothetical protein